MTATEKYVGVVGVDSGGLHIGDPCYGGLSKEDYAKWVEDSPVVHSWPFKKISREGRGITVSHFGGDGTYPVFIKENEAGVVVEIRVVFDQDLV